MDLNWGSVPDWIGVALTLLISLGLGLGGAVYRAQIARQRDELLAASSSGTGNPNVVTFSDGQQSVY